MNTALAASAQPSWADIVQALAALLGGIGIIWGLFYSGRQTQMLWKQERNSTQVRRASLDLELMQAMLSLDRLFIDQPDLYPYLNDNQEIPQEEPDRARVLSCAELILDYADMIARQQRLGQVSNDDVPGWQELLGTYYAESPAVRDQYKRFARGYQDGVRLLLNIDQYKSGSDSGSLP
jgi:hypothetical protein